MDELTNSVRMCLAAANWHGALALALTLPDICASIEFPSETSSKRYVNWWSNYVAPWSGRDGKELTIFDGGDTYALRCAFLHEGSGYLGGHQAATKAWRFQLVYPDGAFCPLANVNGVVYVYVNELCQMICDSVDKWLQNNIEMHKKLRDSSLPIISATTANREIERWFFERGCEIS